MPSRKPRVSASDRRKQLLPAARALFAERGFRGTTTKQIAERAGVNEAIVFRHFRNKEALYWAVLDEMVRGTPGRRQLEEAISGPLRGARRGSEEKIFTDLARGILERSRNDQGFNRLLLFSALENHRLSRKFFRVYIAEYCQVLASFIRSRIRGGVFRKMDALVAARSFVGMVYYHYLAQEILGGAAFHKFDEAQSARTMASIWLQGVRR
jgi:TetR/AcrR family transcriptional regulator